jgi:CBS domain-containing protein
MNASRRIAMDSEWEAIERRFRDLKARQGDLPPAELAAELGITEEAAASLSKVVAINEQVRRYRAQFPLEDSGPRRGDGREGRDVMADRVGDVMRANPVTMDAGAPVLAAAQAMREADIGDVIVVEASEITGTVSERDIVVRVVAEGRDPAATRLGDICRREPTAVAPSERVADARRLMQERALRCLPVVRDRRPVGLVSREALTATRNASTHTKGGAR